MRVEMEIPLGGERGKGKLALCDRNMAPLLNVVKWHLSSGGYAKSQLGLMHRVVIQMQKDELPDELLVDHINGDRLDCRSANLRVTTAKGNAKNKSHDPCHEGLVGVRQVEISVPSTGSRKGSRLGDNRKNPESPVCGRKSPSHDFPSNPLLITYECVHKGTVFFTHEDPRMCALCHDSIVTYCYGSGTRLNDNKLQPLTISSWNIKPDLMTKLERLREKHTDFIGVKKTKDGWKATITVDLGEFDSAEEAARAHDKALKTVSRSYKPWDLNFG